MYEEQQKQNKTKNEQNASKCKQQLKKQQKWKELRHFFSWYQRYCRRFGIRIVHPPQQITHAQLCQFKCVCVRVCVWGHLNLVRKTNRQHGVNFVSISSCSLSLSLSSCTSAGTSPALSPAPFPSLSTTAAALGPKWHNWRPPTHIHTHRAHTHTQGTHTVHTQTGMLPQGVEVNQKQRVRAKEKKKLPETFA